MIEQTAKVHAERWGLGSADRWEFDCANAKLRWIFPDRVAEAPVQILASYNEAASSWRWGWANDSLPGPLRSASEAVREWGEAHGHHALTSPSMSEVSDEQAADLVAIAFRLTGGTGLYRAPSNGPVLFTSFGPVTITRDDGSHETVTFNIE